MAPSRGGGAEEEEPEKAAVGSPEEEAAAAAAHQEPPQAGGPPQGPPAGAEAGERSEASEDPGDKRPTTPGSAAGGSPRSSPRKSRHPECRPGLVMNKYRMSMTDEDFMGEGASSVCWKATNVETKEQVAIKVYKKGGEAGSRTVTMQKFVRQISVLRELRQPFVKPADPSLWSEQLENVKAHRLFMQILDYSTDSEGKPGPDASDGVLYVVTELAQYSLKDYLQLRREQAKPVPKESVRQIAKALVLVVAGLHAKGLVHIDLKPENLMMFNGRLKLIDVDGCVRVGSKLSIQDSSISFSPCYCAPEWARFLIEDKETSLTAMPALDVWSVGMTIGELVTLDAILKPTYANFLCNGRSQREAGFLFMDWLSNIRKAPIPKSVEMFDADFLDLLVNWLLVTDHAKRKTLAQSLDSPFILAATQRDRSSSTASSSNSSSRNPIRRTNTIGGQDGAVLPDDGAAAAMVHKDRKRAEDTSSTKPLHKGMLWKLNTNGDPQEPKHWLQRDMWVTNNGSLCYFSIKENRRLVMIDGSKFPSARIIKMNRGAREHAFEVKYRSDEQDIEVSSIFACESEEACQVWMTTLGRVVNRNLMQTMHFGGSLARDLKIFKLNVRNRRMKVSKDDTDAHSPAFKGMLWKVKAEGDRMREEDWFEREMWIARNGSLVYFSKKEDRELIYYTADDIALAKFLEIDNGASFRPWTFQVKLPPRGDVEFSAGEFAAESEEMRSAWIREFKVFQEESKSAVKEESAEQS